MRVSTSSTALALLAALSLVALTGCGAGATGDTGDDGSSQGSDEGTDSEFEADGSQDGADAAGCSDPILTDPPSTAGDIAITTDSMSPSDLTISVGDVVGFTTGDGQIHGLLVGELSGVTVADGLNEYYRFDAPGTCEVTDELGTGVATITVQ